MSELLVLCYHAISPSWSADLSVTPDAFERQASHFVRTGWTSATFTEALHRPPASKTIVFTFDDAFASVKTYALPVLGRLGATGTVFAPSAYITAQDRLAWSGLDHWERTPAAAELTPMSWDDLGELGERGWEIGSHTRTHPMLSSLDDGALTAELSGSREECAERMGRPVTSIAYPYGDVDDRVMASTRRAGYEAAAALEWPSRRTGVLRYPRVGVYHNDSWPRFRLKVGGWSRSSYGSWLLARRG